MAVEIVKVERIDATSRGMPMCRVTPRNGSIGKTHEQPLLSYIDAALGADQVGFFTGAWSSVVGWGLSNRVADREWDTGSK